MINENTELFVELSDEQQQLVAGGYSYDDGGITDIIHTDLHENQSLKKFSFGAASTREGSYVNQDYANLNQNFDTSAFKYFTDK